MNVLEKMVKNKRLPVLFIGSGIPKRYLKNFPSWDELLNESFSKVNIQTRGFIKFRSI